MSMVERNGNQELSKDDIKITDSTMPIHCFKIEYEIPRIKREWTALVVATDNTDAINKIKSNAKSENINILCQTYIGEIHGISDRVKISIINKYGQTVEGMQKIEEKRIQEAETKSIPSNIIKEDKKDTKSWRLF